MHIETTRIALLGLLIACFLVSLQVNVSNTSAYTASITANDSIELDITPNGNGTSIHSESINVQSDCRAGYNLTIATPEGSDLYKYENNAQSSNTASFTAVDGTSALSSDNNTNKWGYTLTSDPNSNTVFSPLSTTASILKTPSQTASPEADINDTFNINYGAKVDNTVEAGTYQMSNNGAIVYYLTMDTTCTQYTVSFNPNGGTGTMDDQGIETGEPTNLSANDFTAPAFGSSYEDANGDTIVGTANTYWRFNGWNTAIDGTGTPYNNEEEVEDLVGAGSTITLYAQWEALSAMVVNFNTNGMEFEDGTTSNTLGYYHGCVDKYVSQPSYSHTANINDDGTQIDSTTYANNLATKEVVTIPNANSLHVTIKYGTEDNWDMLYVFQGTYAGSVTRNMNAGQLAKYMGGNNTTTTVELDIPGDTATFAFYSDSSGQYWGYHATVVGYYDEEPENYASTIEVCDRSQVYGEYQEPASDDDRLFQGWSEDSSATTPDYTSADDILNNLSGGNGDTKTLYAIWNPIYHITYINNCQTYASANSSCTQAVSNRSGEQTIELDGNGDGSATLGAYNYNSWSLSGWKIKGWSTVPDNSNNVNPEYRISSTYDVSHQGAGSGITLYAHWVQTYTIQYDGNGADNLDGMGTTNADTGIKTVRQTQIGEGDSVNLLVSNFKRAGYGFIGWSTDSEAWVHFTDNDSTNDPIIYGPIETISAPPHPTGGISRITMYAVWVPAKQDGNNNPVYLQDFGYSGCNDLTSTTFDSTTGAISVNKNNIVALTDKRDNEVYAIAKLADKNCWMIENLRLESAGTLGNNVNDASVTNESLAQGYGGTTGVYGNFVGLADPESKDLFTTQAVSNSIYKSSADPPLDTYDPLNSVLEDVGTSDYPQYRIPRYNNNSTTSSPSTPSNVINYIDPFNPTPGTNYSYYNSYGNYYNWAAAMANTNYYTNSASEYAETSICPSGWHLPSSGGAKKEFGVLSKSYGGTGGDQNTSSKGGDIMSQRFRAFPNNYIYSGNVTAAANVNGKIGYYWSRSSHSGGYAEYLYISLNALSSNLSSLSSTANGFSVRCLIDHSYPIQYDGNGADNPNGMGTVDANGVKSVVQTAVSEDYKVTLHAPNFKRAGYGFVGWSTDSSAWEHFTDNDSTNDPAIYGPMETIDAPAKPLNSNALTLYAVWAPVEKDENNDPVYLQDFDAVECGKMTSASFDSTTDTITTTKNGIKVLMDKRDDEVYAVARLADGNCWMMENLRLETAGTTGNNVNDSSVTNEELSQGYGKYSGVGTNYGNFIGLANPETSNFSNSTTANSLYSKTASGNKIVIGSSDNPGYRFPRYSNVNTSNMVDSPVSVEDVTTSYTDDAYSKSNLYSYGNYYTWAAAMASTNYYTGSSTSEAAGTSICPTNWTLPTSGTTAKDFGILSQRYGGTGSNQSGTGTGDIMSNRLRSFPNNFLYSGGFSSSAYSRGSDGFYWSRSAYSEVSSYGLRLYSTNLSPSSSYNKYSGFSVRCLISGS